MRRFILVMVMGVAMATMTTGCGIQEEAPVETVENSRTENILHEEVMTESILKEIVIKEIEVNEISIKTIDNEYEAEKSFNSRKNNN